LYHLKVDPDAVMSNVAVKLFGLNPLFGNSHAKDQAGNPEKPLFEQLSDSGTLFIENIHLLDMEIQNILAGYIKYGHYCRYKSSHKLFSSVRIICSTNQDLQTLVQEGKFSKALFEELKETKLTLPSFLSMPEEEFEELIKGFTEQAVAASPLKNLLELSAHEKFKMFEERPASLNDFKDKVKTALVKKSQKQDIYHEIKFEAAYTISDPELAEAAKLGKKALKDSKVLAMLLRKLKTQSKVADFLGVNRSSINRRLKKYKLI
jgi:DNA-binding NtrC family response regulator